MGKKRKQITVKLESTGKNQKGKPTGYYKMAARNPASKPLDKSIFDPRAIHPETGKLGTHVKAKEKKKLK